MAPRTDISLLNFMIFNSKFGPTEGEEELKIVYYYPKEASVDTKIKDVGLCEAIIKFTNTFTMNSNEVEVLQTQRTMQMYYQPEEDFWMVLTLSAPCERRTKDGTEYNDYRCDELHESVYKGLLKQFYAGFYLLYGGFETCAGNREALCEITGRHFNKYIGSVDLTADITKAWGSVQYLPVNQPQFLRIQTFVNLVEATFEGKIENCVFLYGSKVVWSGLAPENLFAFNEWLHRIVFPKLASTGLQSDLSGSFQSSQYGSYVIGPRTLNCIMPMRKVFYKEFGISQNYDLLIYKALNCVICLFLTSDNADATFYEELATLMGPQMTSISSELTEFQAALAKEKDPTEPNFKYLFFNELTLKHEGTVNTSSIPYDVMSILIDLYGDRRDGTVGEEVIVKTHNDFWIIRKTSNYRHYFLVLNKTSSTLIDITREARKITDQHIRSIFFEKQHDFD